MTYITFDNYRKHIFLEKDFQSTRTILTEISRNEIVNYLLKELNIKDFPTSYGKRRKILEVVLVELSSNCDLTEKFYELLDTLLQDELRQKNITNAKLLPKIYNKPKLSVWNGDITTLKIDAIVNAANNQLLGCFIPYHKCIDYAIHRGAGPRLRKDCHTIMNLQGELEPTGKAKVTRAYNLPSHYVIHTVGPIIKEKLTESHKSDLRNSYLSCLELSKKIKGIRSIAFCSISTGLYGFPFEKAAEIAVETVSNWLEENPYELDQIVFNVFKDTEKIIYERIIRS